MRKELNEHWLEGAVRGQRAVEDARSCSWMSLVAVSKKRSLVTAVTVNRSCQSVEDSVGCTEYTSTFCIELDCFVMS